MVLQCKAASTTSVLFTYQAIHGIQDRLLWIAKQRQKTILKLVNLKIEIGIQTTSYVAVINRTVYEGRQATS